MRVRLRQQEINALLRGRSGPVVQQVTSYTRRTSNRAKQKVGVDSGRLRSSITPTVNVQGKKVVGRVGSVVQYARYHHEGTGVHGPRRRPITPVSSPFLVFPAKGGGLVFTKQVQGSKPNPYLVDALKETVPWPVRVPVSSA